MDASTSPLAIRVGEACAELDALLEAHGVDQWIFITAWNPGPRRPARAINAQRNAELEQLIETLGVPFLRGAGRGEDAAWEPEESFLVLGVDAEGGARLARQFEQAAIVAGQRGGVARLIDCR